MKTRIKSLDKTNELTLSNSFLPSISSTSHKKITAQSYLQNEKYTKTFDQLQKSSNKTLSSKYTDLQKIQATNLKCKKFDKILENLEIVIHESRFPAKRVELSEKVPSTGFIEENTCQNFQVPVFQCSSPLRVKVKVKKGKVEIYTSFKICNPNQFSFDRKFAETCFDVHSPFPVFMEKFFFMGIFAVVGASVKIVYFFGADSLQKKLKLYVKPQKCAVNANFSQKYLQRFKDNPLLKSEFELKVKKIMEKRKNAKRGETSLAKTNLASSLSFKHSIDERLQKVQKQKALIQELKSEARQKLLQKKEIRQMTDKESENIKAILWFRKFFERNWISLIVFSKVSIKLFDLLGNRKRVKLYSILTKMQAYKLQKNIRKNFLKDCPMRIRTLVICKHNLKLYSNSSKSVFIEQFSKRLMTLIKSSSKLREIKTKFSSFHNSIIKIQKVWRAWMCLYLHLYHQFLNFWNQMTEQLISYYSFKSKANKKKKSQILDKLANVPEHIKESCIKSYMKKSQYKVRDSKAFKNFLSKGQKLFTRLILESSIDKTIKLKKIPTILLNK